MHRSRVHQAVLTALVVVVAALGVQSAPASAEPSAAPTAAIATTALPDRATRPVIPSIPAIRRCLTNLRTLSGCAASAAFAACWGTYSKLLGCAGKAYKGYTTYEKIKAFQADTSCPSSLGSLAVYLCRTQPPPAQRAVTTVVANGGRSVRVHTGPGTAFWQAGYYPAGTRLGVVCVALGGEMMRTPDGVLDTGWSRLTNGYFVPRAALARTTVWTENVPWC